MPPADSSAWGRVGRLLASRRVQISARYANRRTFAAERGMNWRTLHDIEHAKRDNFRPETMRAFESAYMLVPGSLDRTLAGSDLEPLPPPQLVTTPPGGDGDPAGDILQGLMDRYPDDHVLKAIAAQSGKPTRTRVAEILEWLDIRGGRRNGTAG